MVDVPDSSGADESDNSEPDGGSSGVDSAAELASVASTLSAVGEVGSPERDDVAWLSSLATALSDAERADAEPQRAVVDASDGTYVFDADDITAVTGNHGPVFVLAGGESQNDDTDTGRATDTEVFDATDGTSRPADTGDDDSDVTFCPWCGTDVSAFEGAPYCYACGETVQAE